MTIGTLSRRYAALLAIVFLAGLLCADVAPGKLVSLFGSGDDDWEKSIGPIIRSNTARQRVAYDVIERRLTLAAALERFRHLSEVRPDYPWATFRTAYPGATDQERFGQQVITYVAAELSDKPEQAHALVARLQGELDSSASMLDSVEQGSPAPAQ